jgi:Tfp pilus assembly protein PilF/DNA-binding CsgD family transcriptional regulator
MPPVDRANFDNVLDKLTPRRREVLLNVLAGASDPEIAETLGISPAAVRKHIERICAFFAAELPDYAAGEVKRSDLLRLGSAHRPDLVLNPGDALAIADLPEPSSHNGSSPSPSFNVLMIDDGNRDRHSDRHTGGLSIGDMQERAKELNQLGAEEYGKGNFELAQRYLAASVALDPQKASAHYNLGSVYERMGDRPMAIQHYQQALRLEGRAVDAAANNLARLEILAGQPELALERLQPRLDQVSDAWVETAMCKNLGWAYYQLAQYEDAVSILHRALTIDPDYTAAHCLLAQVYDAQGKKPEAIACWRQCLESPLEKGQAWIWPELEVWQAQAFQRLRHL